jgi:hypothetical protein
MIQPLRGLLWPEFALRGDAEPLRAPLWPAGHLPHKGGDYAGRRLSTLSATPVIGESADDSRSPPSWGRWPAGQRGARRGKNLSHDASIKVQDNYLPPNGAVKCG